MIYFDQFDFKGPEHYVSIGLDTCQDIIDFVSLMVEKGIPYGVTGFDVRPTPAIELANVTLHGIGISNNKATVWYQDSGECTDIDIPGYSKGIVIPLDSYEFATAPTLIKLDIEGHETKALTGMRDTLIKYKPKLAIAVYHRNWHPWIIDYFIKALDVGYSTWTVHYGDDPSIDTILYAEVKL